MVKTQANARDSFKMYKALSENPTDVKTYLLIGDGYRQFLMDKVIEGHEVTLPSKMGTISIIGSKRTLRFNEEGKPILPIDWKKTKQLWDRNPQAKEDKKLVYCTNEATSGVVYKFLWSKLRFSIENKTLYALRMTRDNKRAVHKAIKEGAEYYIKNR